MQSYLNYIIKEFIIESWDGVSSPDLKSCIASVQYFEDLFSPAIFLTVTLVNTDGLLTSFINKDSSMSSGIKGGERVRLVIDQPATKKSIKLEESKNEYYISKVYGTTVESTRELFAIELSPIEVFTNETARVFKRYPEKDEQPIDKSVSQIISQVLKSSRNTEVEPTLNSYAFYGNSKKPFTVLTWLCPKAIPNIGKSGTTFGTAGYLFYQNKNGFNFKSVDNLMSKLKPQSGDSKNIQTFYLPNAVDVEFDPAANTRIVSMPVFEKNINIIENLRIGMYSSVNYFYDINTRQPSFYEYKLKESYDIMKHTSNRSEKLKIPKGLEDSPSRIMVKIVDGLVKSPIDTPIEKNSDDRSKYQSQSVARYNLAFTQMLNITVPLNLNLTVGDVVRLEFGKITKKESEKGTKDDLKSGLYLIKELSHLFEKNQGYTGLKLVRDSYGDQ